MGPPAEPEPGTEHRRRRRGDAALAIAVLFDAPTPVFLLVALVIARSFLTVYSRYFSRVCRR